MNLKDKEYIILEIIPTSVDPKCGDIVQLQALKINNGKLIKRFDYRLDKSLVKIPELLDMTNYDNETFRYVKKTKTIMNNFKKFIGNLPLLIIDNLYTNNYLKDIKNKKISIFKYFDIEVSDNCFNELIKKYNLQSSNHLVDLLYEALLMEL